MKSHGTASEFPGWWVEFAANALRNLPRPEEIGQAVAEAWSRNGKTMSKVLYSELVQPKVLAKHKVYLSFPVSVDYDRPVADAIKEGDYELEFMDHKDGLAVACPTSRKGKVQIPITLVHFNEDLREDYTLKELDEMGFRPAELREAITLVEQYPTVDEFSIVFRDLWHYNEKEIVPSWFTIRKFDRHSRLLARKVSIAGWGSVNRFACAPR